MGEGEELEGAGPAGVTVAGLAGVTGRAGGLLDAVGSCCTSLELDTVLDRVAAAGVELTGAEYGAVGVYGPDRVLADFHTAGLDAAARLRIGPLPAGRGILGLFAGGGPGADSAVRLDDVPGHPAAVGFPVDDPPMQTFLGAPVWAEGERVGALYLANKPGGPFSAQDEAAVQALATVAGPAIRNAQRYERSQRRERWLSAAAEITTALLAGDPPEQVLPMIARSARVLCGADCAAVFVPSRDSPSPSLVVAAADAADTLRSQALTGALAPVTGSVCGRVFRDGVGIRVDDLAAESPPASDTEVDFGPALAVPLASKGAVLGTLLVLRVRGAARFPAEAVEVTESFARQAALAAHLAETRRAERRLTLLEDRERIAVDLQDNLIQRLFATGLLVESVRRRLGSPPLREKLHRVAAQLDETIRDTRKTIKSLQSAADPDHPELRQRLLAAIAEATASTPVNPSVQLDGPLDALVPADIADGAVAVVREAVSDVVRHGARRITVTVTASDALAVTVADDVAELPVGEWLDELSDRAAEFGGELILDPCGTGSRLVWTVPLH